MTDKPGGTPGWGRSWAGSVCYIIAHTISDMGAKKMINIGIVIAVSDYSGDAAPLPACGKDGEAIAALLKSDPRFDDVLLISGDTKSSVVKPKLIDFLGKFKGKEIGDVVFYFSGHGDFSGDDFYYLLSDFEQKRRKQTSLENSELDNLIRHLSPALFVKIVDACHSGVAYIKSTDDFREYLKGATGKFNKLYFMFSSQSEQFSYQDNNLSYFTKRLIEAIVAHQVPTIRYKEIIDFVSDAFEGDVTQTPFFITQADFTEIFCEVSSTLKKTIESFLPPPSLSASSVANKIKPSSVAELIKEDARLYCTKEEALEAVSLLPKLLREIRISGDLQSLFDLTTDEVSSTEPPNSVSIARWFEQSKDDRRYFVVVKKETRPITRQVPRHPLSSAITGFMSRRGDDDYVTVTTNSEVVTGYKSTVELPFNYATVFAKPNFPNLNAASCYVAPIVSMTHLRIFWAFVLYENIAWDDRRMIGKIEWTTDEAHLKDTDKIKQIIESIGSNFLSFIEKPIKAKWVPQDTNETPLKTSIPQ